MKLTEILKRLLNDGWTQVSQKGSHRQFKHPVKKGGLQFLITAGT